MHYCNEGSFVLGACVWWLLKLEQNQKSENSKANRKTYPNNNISWIQNKNETIRIDKLKKIKQIKN